MIYHYLNISYYKDLIELFFFILIMSLLPFTHPFTCTVAGPTMCGKSFFVSRLISLSKTHITPQPDQIIYFYKEWQPLFTTMKNVIFKKEIPSLDDFNGNKKTLIIIDDMMGEVKIASFFTKGAHHRNLSVINLVQNLYHDSKDHRTVNLNSQYLVLFKNPRNKLQIEHLGRTILGREYKELVYAYNHATQSPFSYLLLDLRQETSDDLRIRSMVLNDCSLGKSYIGVYI